MKIKCGMVIFKRVDGELFFLLILKKYTYAFMRLLLGKYNERAFLKLEGGISEYEKTILSMNLNIKDLYRRYFPNFKIRNRDLLRIATKFDLYKKRILIRTGLDFYTWLKKMKTISPPWEIPKGGIKNDEDLIKCAIREINEETGVIKNDLYIHDGIYSEIIYP